MTSTSTNQPALTSTEFSLGLLIRSLEEAISLFQEGCENRFEKDGCIPGEDRDLMNSTIGGLLNFRENLDANMLAVIDHEEVTDALDAIIEQVDQDLAVEEATDSLLAALGIDRAEIEALVNSFFEGVNDAPCGCR